MEFYSLIMFEKMFVLLYVCPGVLKADIRFYESQFQQCNNPSKCRMQKSEAYANCKSCVHNKWKLKLYATR